MIGHTSDKLKISVEILNKSKVSFDLLYEHKKKYILMFFVMAVAKFRNKDKL